MSLEEVLNVLTHDNELPTVELERQETSASVNSIITNMPENLREILILNSSAAVNELMQDATAEEMEMLMERELLQGLIQFALIVVATLPVLVAYPFVQKYFVKGVMIGAVKG